MNNPIHIVENTKEVQLPGIYHSGVFGVLPVQRKKGKVTDFTF